MASRFEQLAPELRVQILQHVVRSQYPIRNRPAWRACNGQSPVADIFDTSILRISRQMSKGALAALHQVNTIVLPVPLSTYTGDRDLLRKCRSIVLKFDSITGEPEDVRDLVKKIHHAFPQAKRVTLRLCDSPFTGGLLFSCLERLAEAGFCNIRFTEIGMLRAESCVESDRLSTLTLLSPYLVERWAYFSKLPRAHADLRRHGTRLISEPAIASRQDSDAPEYRQRIIRLGIVTLLERMRMKDRNGEAQALKKFQCRYPMFEDDNLDSFAYQTAWIHWLRGVIIPDGATL